MQDNIVYIGMDLGTFKTSVVSSTGARDVVHSAVGWPKDHVARALLGRDVVFGKDVVQQRLALNVVRPFERGVLKYVDQTDAKMPKEKVEKHREAARLLVEHAVALTEPPAGAPVYGVIGAPARATLLNKKFLMEAAQSAFDAVVIVSEPFTVAYGMNRLSDTLVVDIGAGTIDICPIYGTYPSEEEQITLPLGGDFVDEEFGKRLHELCPQAQVSPNMLREIKEKYGFVHDVNERAVVTLPLNGKPQEVDVTEPLKAACQTIGPPIVQGLCELIAKFDPEFQQRMRNNIVLGGGGSQLKGLDRIIEEGLKEYGGGKVTKVYDAMFAGAVGALKLARGMPAQGWHKIKRLQHQEARVPVAV